MSEQAAEAVLLMIRGTLVDGAKTEAARKTHNATAGNAAGVAAARALGDLSHKVFTPANTERSGTQPEELLILDAWQTPEGIEKFFADPQVKQGGGMLFAQRDPSVWMRAKGGFGFNLPAPMNRTERYVGIVRAKVKSAAAALDVFAGAIGSAVNQARQRGQLSHELYFRLAQPSKDGSAELLGVDVWTDLQGMQHHYAEHMAALSKAFAGPPEASIWTQPPGEWVEW